MTLLKLTHNNDEYNFDTLLRERSFKIPYFQRAYKWKKAKAIVFIEDIIQIHKENAETLHFMGATILYPLPGQSMSAPASFEIIDGQQRVTSVFITILVLVELLLDINTDQSRAEACGLMRKYIYDPNYQEEVNLKLQSSKGDYTQFKFLIDKIIDRHPYTRKKLSGIIFFNNQTLDSGTVITNYSHIKNTIKNSGIDYKNLTIVNSLIEVLLTKLTIVTINIDNPISGPKIYHSLNSGQEPTTVGELVRNEIFRSANISTVNRSRELERLYLELWVPFVTGFNGEDKLIETYLNALAVAKNKEVTKEKIFLYLINEWKQYSTALERMQYLDTYTKEFLTLVHGDCSGGDYRLEVANKKIKNLIKNLKLLQAPAAMYPFLIRILNDYKKEILSSTALIEILSLFESFLVRRNVCGIEQTGLNLYFKVLYEKCDSCPTVDKIVSITKNNYGTIQLPSDKYIEEKIISHNVSRSRSLLFILREYNNELGGDLIEDLPFTKEHILPQTLSDSWEQKFSKLEHKSILHTLPNLIPLSIKQNASLSNAYYDRKRSSYLENSQYKMTRDFAGEYSVWDMNNYKKRAVELTNWINTRFKDYFRT